PKIPPIHLVMVLTEEAEPPFQMHRLAPNLPTQLVEVWHKGKYVGVVGIFADKKADKKKAFRLEYRLEYQAVLMAPELDTKEENKAKHPVIQLMERYNQQLK